ncbi:hypothetical protein ACFV0G_25290, partial [Kitasatospora sp. NPDC059571]
TVSGVLRARGTRAGRRRGRIRLLAAAGLVFALAMVPIVAVEAVAGKPLHDITTGGSGTGTSFNPGRGGEPARTPVTGPSATPSGAAAGSPSPSGHSPSATAVPSAPPTASGSAAPSSPAASPSDRSAAASATPSDPAPAASAAATEQAAG